MQPITLIPWHTDFMPALTEYLVRREDFSDLTVLFPHNRPRRHLKALLTAHAALPRPVFMPQMTSIAEFVSGLHRNLSETPFIQANQLDLVTLLFEVVNDLRTRSGSLLSRLPELDLEAFLPWGIRLAKLMDDLLRQDITPQDLTYMQGEVSSYAAGLLEQIQAIHEAFIDRVRAKGWTTAGLSAKYILEHLDAVETSLNGKPIIAAGFYALSGAEDTLFKTLWQAGLLHPIIHGDPAMANTNRPHWAAAEHSAWLERWRTHAEIPDWAESAETKPAVRFCEGYDRHSQLAGLVEDMQEADGLDETAVVLPDEGALLPILHMLPEKEPNISMGYPLERTSLARLIETLLTLQENRLDDGRYYWRDLIALIRHPYLRLLGPDDKPLRKVLHIWESRIREGEKYVDPFLWEPPYTDEILDEVDKLVAEPLRQEVLRHCLTSFEQADTLAKVGDALNTLAALLHAQGERLWHTYLIDAECLFRLTSSVIPELKSAEASHEEFSRTTLYSFLRRMLSQERVSFEPEPLAGLQVLGVLETRLLHFKRLFILDAVEERLPGTNPYDPLLPDPLRKLLGLPDARERDNVSGYNFYRLLMGAQEAVIYYQSGVQPGLLDSKSVRSRFVEQLLWEQEQKKGKILDTDDALIHSVTFPASPLPSGPDAIPVTDAIRSALLEKLTSRGLSPSSLDRYMNCPKQFFYAYLTRVRPIQSVDEDGDRSEFGSLIHEVLKEFLTPYIGIETELGKLDAALLMKKFNDIFAASDFFARLPLDTRMGLKETGRYRLTEFLASQQTATLMGLEKSLQSQVEIDGTAIPFSGQIDRIEQRDQEIFILDYKTGNAPMPKKGFWQDMELIERLESYGRDVIDPTLLTDLAAEIRSVQLPAYLYLYSLSERQYPAYAGLIKLGENGSEQLLFGPKWTPEERAEAVEEMTPLLVQTLVRHMLLAADFAPQPGTRCTWCDYSIPCGK
ncbi:PD-(D/E)XK nuclease family protein [Pseudodesulfovibrio sediminis]|uniref:PD-(D/E)XK endonuclease-like domain-containing protein n=1 Tax=Pseudodesulfovibrio sediminis TaxID=2810563 RepID=A0ABM8HYQ8_9BACT|nr:PD-(D/E)XK nuclease family protein [Pseudodesulfovibrio sediminis]BCS86933.1 hypothetical protein PSDVSF_01750 [Pseudodesulfovibrio sediminis]